MPVGGPPSPPPPPLPNRHREDKNVHGPGGYWQTYIGMSGAAFGSRTREIRASHLLEIFDELLPRDGIRFVSFRFVCFGKFLQEFFVPRFFGRGEKISGLNSKGFPFLFLILEIVRRV